MELSNRTCLIVGASGAIGSAVAECFHREGARVALTYCSELSRGSLERWDARQSRAAIFPLDVRYRNNVEAVVAETEKQFGPIGVLVNCSGVLGPVGPVEDVPGDAFARTIEINLIGCFHLVRAVLPSMRAAGGGKIILFSGGGAAYGRPFFTAYSASKAAVVRFAESMAGELRDSNIQINAIAPGPVRSRMWEELRASGTAAGAMAVAELKQMDLTGGVSAERAAALALFLASDLSQGLTGRLISALHDKWEQMGSRIPAIMASDGGMLRRVPLD